MDNFFFFAKLYIKFSKCMLENSQHSGNLQAFNLPLFDLWLGNITCNQKMKWTLKKKKSASLGT